MSSDEVLITQVINRYGLAVDCQAWPMFDDVFTDDIVADYGGPAPFTGLPQFKELAAQTWGLLDSSMHAMTSTVVDLHGDEARTMTYGLWLLGRRDVKGGDWWEGKGWYDDQFVRTGAGWRIRRRTCRVMHWTGNPNLLNPASDSPGPPTFSLRDAYRDGQVAFFS